MRLRASEALAAATIASRQEAGELWVHGMRHHSVRWLSLVRRVWRGVHVGSTTWEILSSMPFIGRDEQQETHPKGCDWGCAGAGTMVMSKRLIQLATGVREREEACRDLKRQVVGRLPRTDMWIPLTPISRWHYMRQAGYAVPLIWPMPNVDAYANYWLNVLEPAELWQLCLIVRDGLAGVAGDYCEDIGIPRAVAGGFSLPYPPEGW